MMTRSPKAGVLHSLALMVGLALGAAGSARAAHPACAALDAPDGAFDMRVPFEVIAGRIYLQATVDGRGPFRFALDTGASGFGRADASLVSALGLATDKPALNSDGVSTAEAQTVVLASLDVGGLSRKDLRVITRDYNSRMSPDAAFSGIVAREFFADGLLVIDYPRKTVAFARSLSLSPDQPGVLVYEKAFRMPVTIGAVHATGNLDTGANVAFVLPRALYDQVSSGPTEQAGTGHLANGEVQTERAVVAGPFRIGEVELTDMEVRVSDRYPELLVGAHALQRFSVLIDQRSRSVALCR